jgi:hypothetical protein
VACYFRKLCCYSSYRLQREVVCLLNACRCVDPDPPRKHARYLAATPGHRRLNSSLWSGAVASIRTTRDNSLERHEVQRCAGRVDEMHLYYVALLVLPPSMWCVLPGITDGSAGSTTLVSEQHAFGDAFTFRRARAKSRSWSCGYTEREMLWFRLVGPQRSPIVATSKDDSSVR